MKVLNELRQFYPLDELLRAAEIPRSTFYYHLKALSKPDKYADVKKRISEIYHENRGRYGYRRVTLSLHREGKQINHKAVQRLMGTGFAPIFPDICYHLTHYKPAAADIPVASDNPAHYADAIRYNARTPLQGSLLPLTRLVWA